VRIEISLVREPLTRADLRAYRLDDALVKAVVDIERRILAVGGELHADEESFLLARGSAQEHLWGINLYPDDPSESWLEFDSMINLRPSQGNRSRGVDDPAIRETIRRIVGELIRDA
jgi:hypothetical protein